LWIQDLLIGPRKSVKSTVLPYIPSNGLMTSPQLEISAYNYVKKKWILWLDADEELDQERGKFLLKELEETRAKVIVLPVLNYYGDFSKIRREDYYLLYQPRLFRNYQGITFVNKIHEALKFQEKIQEDEVERVNVPIHHYGYMEDLIDEKNKSDRNLALLKEELSDPEHSPWIEYHIVSELYRQKNFEAAFQFVNLSIMRFIKEEIYPPSLLYKLKYEMLIETENWEGAWPGIDKALELYPDYVDLHYYKGLILYHLSQYEEALKSFNHCLKLGDQESKHLILNGVGSFMAKEYCDLCLEKIGKEDPA